ncbi:hypothetical protein NIES4075_51970 [Tolypothrix sp. NIES-4075]|nr:hypothetical protein NIES4075_51970 [Tolypothrix sp. NIES-4075]
MILATCFLQKFGGNKMFFNKYVFFTRETYMHLSCGDISHNMGTLTKLCTKAIYLNQGQIQSRSK